MGFSVRVKVSVRVRVGVRDRGGAITLKVVFRVALRELGLRFGVAFGLESG